MAIHDFVSAPLSYSATRSALAWKLVTGLSRLPSLNRQTEAWDGLIEFIFTFADEFMRPRQVRSEIRSALETIEELRPKHILEIGTAAGGTFFLLARAAHPEATIISLDLPGGEFGGGYANWKTQVFRRAVLKGQIPHFIRSDSHSIESLEQVRGILGGAPLDVLFIDGDHTYEGVKRDFELYAPLVRRGGMVVLHDIAQHLPNSACNVRLYWKDLQSRYPVREIIESENQGWAGIGVIRVP
jgi:predicted O-methyltransferase YrrM